MIKRGVHHDLLPRNPTRHHRPGRSNKPDLAYTERLAAYAAFSFVLICKKTSRKRAMSKKFSQEYQPDLAARPTRGPDKRTMILEALKQSGKLTLSENATNTEVERAWFAKIAEVALDNEHKDSGICKQALLDRGWAKSKPEATPVLFDYDKDATATDKANSILEAASLGHISVEDAGKLLTAIKDTLQIQESTELVKRLEEIEARLSKA